MSANTKIEWCDHTFNPWEGCQKVGPGCDHCYAEARNARFGGGVAINWGPGALRRRTSPANWALPKRWNAQADAFKAQYGRRQRVFCASLADVFDNAVERVWRDDLATLILDTPNLDWLLLTKRIGNAGAMLGEMFLDGPPENLWLGATITEQPEADRDIPKLLQVPARVRFLSMEPLLGPVDLTKLMNPGPLHQRGAFINALSGGTYGEVPATGERLRITHSPLEHIDWVIVGGESGPGARPMHPDWVSGLRDQCAEAGVPFLFKQWGNWRTAAWFDGPDSEADSDDDFVDLDRTEHMFVACDGRTWDTLGGRFMYPPLPLGHWCLMVNEGKKATGRLLAGRTHDDFPGGIAP
jgi:protein gp37